MIQFFVLVALAQAIGALQVAALVRTRIVEELMFTSANYHRQRAGLAATA